LYEVRCLEKTIETKIVEIDKFYSTVSVHEEVYIYRRLADIYDPTAISILNTKKEIVGYLDRDIAEIKILPKIKKGIKFRCFVTGPPDGEIIPISIIETDDIESTLRNGPVSQISNPSRIQLPDEEYSDDKIDEPEDEAELEYPDLDELKIDENDDGEDWV